MKIKRKLEIEVTHTERRLAAVTGSNCPQCGAPIASPFPKSAGEIPLNLIAKVGAVPTPLEAGADCANHRLLSKEEL